MRITRISTISGKPNTLDVPGVTHEALALYEGGHLLLQDAFPTVPAPLREFLKTGITPEEWIATFGTPDDEQAERAAALRGTDSQDDLP